MPVEHVCQRFNPPQTPWHITFGTYGTRLHGDSRPTVDREHNQLGTSFLSSDAQREAIDRKRMKFAPRYFTTEQREFIESTLPGICRRGGWRYRVCAAAADHVHLLCDAAAEVHGKEVRRLVKRWLGQDLCRNWPIPAGATWWAEGGSNKAIDNERYLNNCFIYIHNQRTTPFAYSIDDGAGTGAEDRTDVGAEGSADAGAEDGPARSIVYRFHVNLFAAPRGESFACTWEDAAARLEKLPRMIFELDGSFVVSGNRPRAGAPSPAVERWQVDGHLFDFDARLYRLELHGSCPPTDFDALLRCVDWPEQALAFEMVREGTTLDEAAFRDAAAG